MKKFILIILTFGFLNLGAQSVVQGTIGTAGTTINADDGTQINFTLGQPFGEGEMSESELTIIQGLQGANVNIVEGPAVSSGIVDYSNLEADISFEQSSGAIRLYGFNLDEVSGDVIVSDLNGRVLQQGRLEGGQFQTLNLDRRAVNMYIITVLTDDKKRLSKKIIF